MLAKFFVFALFCVALAKAQADDVSYAIEKAIYRVQGLATGAYRATDSAIKEVEYKKRLIQMKSAVYLEKQNRIQVQFIQNLERTADEMEKKAQEANKPPSVFECISRAESQAIDKLESLAPKFETDIRRLERTKLASIDVNARPLVDLRTSLEERYNRAIVDLKKCKTIACVRKIMDRVTREYDVLLTNLRRIQSQVGTNANQFIRDATTMINNYSRQANSIQGDGLRSIRNCVYRRFFEKEEEEEDLD